MLDEEEVSKYMMLIGSMNWSITIGRIDVMFAANTLARYSCATHHENFKTALKVFGYLKYHPKGAIKFETRILEDIEEENMNKSIFLKDLYLHAKERIPKDAPTPKRRVAK